MSVLAAAGWAATSKKPSPLKYEAWVASSAESNGCLGKPGVYSQLSILLPKRMPRPELEKLTAKNKPTNVKLAVGNRTYRLTIDASSSFAGNGQIGWAFMRLPTDARAAKGLISRKAVISYSIGNQRLKAKTVTVQDGRCKSVF